MIVKVCGMRDAENIRELDRLHIADWMGFIFYPKSSRYVATLPEYMPQYSKRIGVFVNEDIHNIVRICKDFNLHIIQLHGNESPDYCRQLKNAVGPDVGIMKTIPLSTSADMLQSQSFQDCSDYLLFETKCSGYGGSGQQFDWHILDGYNGDRPFLLTGGIGPEDAEKIKQFTHPKMAGIDLNSRFESGPAVKDIRALNQFINKLRSYE